MDCMDNTEKYSIFLKNLVLSIFTFKMVLLLLYFIGDYQYFTVTTVKLLARIILSNDIISFVINIAYIFFLITLKNYKIKIFLLLSANIIFSLLTIFTSLLIIVL